MRALSRLFSFAISLLVATVTVWIPLQAPAAFSFSIASSPLCRSSIGVTSSSKVRIAMSSLFDEEPTNNDSGESNNGKTPAPRKFTGNNNDYTYTSTENNRPAMSAQARIRQREFNLVSSATSPEAFLGQAALIVAMLVLVVVVGATGQLGINDNNEYDTQDEEGFWNAGSDETYVQPQVEILIPQKTPTSVWL